MLTFQNGPCSGPPPRPTTECATTECAPTDRQATQRQVTDAARSSRARALRPLLWATAALVAATATAFPTQPAHAGKSAATPLTRHLESLTVGGAVEHRLIALHPLYRSLLERQEVDRVTAHAVPPERIGVALAKDGRRPALEILNEGQEHALLVPGTVFRLKDRDYVVPGYAVGMPVAELEVPVAPLSADIAADDQDPSLQPHCLPGVLPPTLRWITRSPRPEREVLAEIDAWLGEVELALPRGSAADLPANPAIAKRVKDYAKKLGGFGKGPDGTECLGYAALLDGVLVGIETFASGDDFRAAWPGILLGLAVESAVEELRQNLIEEDIPPSGDPDRYLRSLKERILSIYPEKPAWDDVPHADSDRRVMRVAPRTGDAVRALVHENRVTHLVILSDPAKRRRETAGEDLDPGQIGRKSRPSEAEKRWKERRDGRGPPVPPIPDGE